MISNWQKYFTLKQRLFFLLSVAVSTIVFLYLKTIISLSDLSAIIRRLPLTGLLLYILFSLTMSIFRTWRYAVLLRIGGHVYNKKILFLITLVRNLFSDLLPARLGTLIYIYLVRTKLGASWSSASASFAYSFIFDILSLSFLILLAAFATTGLSHHPELLILAGLALACCSCAILLFLPQILQLCASLLSKLRLLKQTLALDLNLAYRPFKKKFLSCKKAGCFCGYWCYP